MPGRLSVLTCNRPPAREGQPAVPARTRAHWPGNSRRRHAPWVREPAERAPWSGRHWGPALKERCGQTGVAGASRALSRSHSRGESIVSESF